MEEKEETMTSKKAFFYELYAQDEVETTDESENEAVLALNASKEQKAVSAFTPEQKTTIDARLPAAMGRTVSSPGSLEGTSRSRTDDVIDRVKETPIAPAAARPQISKQTSVPEKGSRGRPAKQTLPASKAGKKRKRGQSIDLLPIGQQIFRGKMFCKVLHWSFTGDVHVLIYI